MHSDDISPKREVIAGSGLLLTPRLFLSSIGVVLVIILFKAFKSYLLALI